MKDDLTVFIEIARRTGTSALRLSPRMRRTFPRARPRRNGRGRNRRRVMRTFMPDGVA